MASTIPGGDILSGVLNVIAQSLLLPVMILLVIFIIFAIIELGSILAEYTSRKKITSQEKAKLIEDITVSPKDQMCNFINNSNFNKRDKEILCIIANLNTTEYDSTTREILARNLLEGQENNVLKSLEKDDIVAKVGSACGLLGTIIPMGPGLAALGAGDMTTLTSNLTVAFNTTTAGLAAGSLCYVIAKIRRRWYQKDIGDLYDVAEAILEVLKCH
ncbi:MotA/TolQ/ExbB proton channel family protein [Methanosphaera cuniculi]|uniref:Flagellar motor protein MotA n=1 Tax=Methanosphaera cuniculi TaxID=1077256 RepID=A0A2A2HCC3_9EURY|nr:MotA/TolQ/ExbB proton channel family protein [Methanosphaera cuniculi]PAV07027.1 flagellar motor protein MotA [Methanosphaera cuniculi]PWL08916.1 hypothetical protein MSCUN_01830 [Methanosphaera cuniculi]